MNVKRKEERQNHKIIHRHQSMRILTMNITGHNRQRHPVDLFYFYDYDLNYKAISIQQSPSSNFDYNDCQKTVNSRSLCLAKAMVSKLTVDVVLQGSVLFKLLGSLWNGVVGHADSSPSCPASA